MGKVKDKTNIKDIKLVLDGGDLQGKYFDQDMKELKELKEQQKLRKENRKASKASVSSDKKYLQAEEKIDQTKALI